MEDLREKVYECTLAVEAHMICDLLARAGISSRVDGEFLAGAGGDLLLGVARRYEGDEDFDGYFETRSDVEAGNIVTSSVDSNADGRPDIVSQLENGVLRTADVYDEPGRRVVARQHFELFWNNATDFDDDGDGTFERRVEYDRYGNPKPH